MFNDHDSTTVQQNNETRLADCCLLLAFSTAGKKGPAHIAGPVYISFCRNLLRAGIADHLHVGHAQIGDRLFA